MFRITCNATPTIGYARCARRWRKSPGATPKFFGFGVTYMFSSMVDPVGSWKPSKARSEFRTNPSLEGKSSSGYCMGYLQANLAILPSALADDFGRFCELNKAPCPLLYRSGIGELSAGNLAPNSDVTYEISRSNIYELVFI